MCMCVLRGHHLRDGPTSLEESGVQHGTKHCSNRLSRCFLDVQDTAFVTTSLRNLTTVLQIRRQDDGSLMRELPLPEYDSIGGTITDLCPGQGATDFFYIYSSMTDPGSIYRCVPAV